jgi:energy-coupling factor transport system ATP-binding protein
MATFEISNLVFTYPEAEKPALDGVTLRVEDGEFLVICGKSGCGKTTLLRHFKPALTPHGEKVGEILFKGNNLEEVDQRIQSSEIGYVLQSPENQIVTDKVWHELAFGLESLGYDNQTIRLRVAEMASYFGIQDWFKRNVTELSGGQKQLLNLASIMALQPSVLILDEPTSQLDPIAASDFLGTIKKINQDLGTTIILTEHRLEEVFPLADRVVVMEQGKIVANDSPQEIGSQLKTMKNDMFIAMPTPMQIYAGVKNDLTCPLTVKDGREWMSHLFKKPPEIIAIPKKDVQLLEDKPIEDIIELKDVWFKYDRGLPDVVRDLSIKVKKGEMYCIVGGNGTGKTTTLSIISGINKPYRGKVFLKGIPIKKFSNQALFFNFLGVLPQNPQSLFVKKTVLLDLFEMFKGKKVPKTEQQQKIDKIIKITHLEDLLNQHPYDLSGGEQQRLALAKILLTDPKVLLLDEPTKGLDNHYKQEFGQILKNLQCEKDVTILMVSHDIEFCAQFGDYCGLFFDGGIVTDNTTVDFFSGNSFYTTASNRMSRHVFDNVVTVKEAIQLCKMNL